MSSFTFSRERIQHDIFMLMMASSRSTTQLLLNCCKPLKLFHRWLARSTHQELRPTISMSAAWSPKYSMASFQNQVVLHIAPHHSSTTGLLHASSTPPLRLSIPTNPSPPTTSDMDEYMAEDRISELDDQTLISILSLLTVKEAESTCVLSKRWRYLWPFTSCLDFEAKKKLSAKSWNQQKEMRKKYRSWVNHVLKLHQSSIVDEFRVCDFDGSSNREIDSWIDFAIKKRVKRLEIDLDSHGVIPKKYVFQEQSHSYFKTPCGMSNIKSLTHLSLKSVNITDECLEHFLSHSPLLAYLTVDGSRDLVNLKVYGLSLMLKFLKISRCTRLESVEICAPKLVTFIYFGTSDRIKFDVDYAPSLIELSLGEIRDSVIGAFLSFSRYFSRIETLTLCMSMKSTTMAPPHIPKLISLKDLKLQVSADDQHSLLSWTTSLLNASPLLERLSLQLECWSIERARRRREVKCPHQCLKVVEIAGFVGGVVDYELAWYLSENAVALEMLKIDHRPVLCWQQPPRDFEETKNRRMAKGIAEELKRKLKRKHHFRAEIQVI